MSEASDRVLCKRMVRFGKDLVLDVNQVTAVVTTYRADTVHLDDGRGIDVSEDSANLVRDYFGHPPAKDGEDKQDAQDGKADWKRSALAKARTCVGLILCAMLDALGAAGGEDGEDGDEDKGEGAGEEAKES